MLDMHMDMEGSAVAVGSLYALHALRSPLAVDCWLAITENRTGPTAYKPQDVVTGLHNGTTIQVIHTDAEGRMVLADTLSLAASTRKPRAIIDYATLTGACVYALTERYSGAFTNRPEAREVIEAAGSSSGERVWCFPMDADFDADLESSVADVLQCATEGKGDHIHGRSVLESLRAQEHRVAAPRPRRRGADGRSCAHRHRDHRLRSALHARPAAARLARDNSPRAAFCTANAAQRSAAPFGRRAGQTPPRPRFMNRLTIQRPDDWHVHLRDGVVLKSVVKFTAERFGRAIVMPNLKPAVTTTAQASAYRARIMAALPVGARFEPLMTLYLTDFTAPQEIDKAKAAGFVHGVKLYPAGATTHSDAGVTDIRKVRATLARMEEVGMPLLVHGETPGADVDVFDREAHFIDAVLIPLLERYPKLPVVFEHITTARAAEFVRAARNGVAATITPQHLLLNRNAIFSGGIKPHHYCLPILKRERDREALLHAAVSGDPRFFLGTDSAPHERAAKENACGCAGMFTAHAAG